MLLHDHVPAYITWDRFESNQTRLTANRQLPGTPGAPRNGPAVLAGPLTPQGPPRRPSRRDRFDGAWTAAPLHRLTHARMET